jgi:hypothetical protein
VSASRCGSSRNAGPRDAEPNAQSVVQGSSSHTNDAIRLFKGDYLQESMPAPNRFVPPFSQELPEHTVAALMLMVGTGEHRYLRSHIVLCHRNNENVKAGSQFEHLSSIFKSLNMNTVSRNISACGMRGNIHFRNTTILMSSRLVRGFWEDR